MMKPKFHKESTLAGCLVVLVAFAIALALSWGITAGLVFLICKCFSWEFSLLTATGIWLIILLASSAFRGEST